MKTTEKTLEHMLAQVSEGKMTPREVLKRITPNSLSKTIYPKLTESSSPVFATGVGVQSGDVSGRLIIGRDVAMSLISKRNSGEHTGEYIYSTASGDVEDFLPIEHCAAFFTSNPARTEFCAVQSVLEGKPTIIATKIEYHESKEIIELPLNANGKDSKIKTRKRWITSLRDDGTVLSIEEGRKISISGADGVIFQEEAGIGHSKINRVYRILTEAYEQAQGKYGIYQAWDRIQETESFSENACELKDSINSAEFKGFQKVVQFALSVSSLEILANVHKPSCVAMAKLASSVIIFDDSGLQIRSSKNLYGVGLLRDERMWVNPEDIDVLRVLLLGPDCTSPEQYQDFCNIYKDRHGKRYQAIFATETGSTCVIRTLCMPISKFLPDDFDIESFSERMGLDKIKAKSIFRTMASEREVYHGCRGIRMFVARPDLMEIWLRTVLEALKESQQQGVCTRVKFLLATLTFPEEAKRFLQIMEEIVIETWASLDEAPIDGVATMLETGGAYIGLEEILDAHGQRYEMVGGLIGVNDFTTACLNMNRGDAPKFLIPKYIENEVF